MYCEIQEPLWLLNVIEDDYQLSVVHTRLSALCKTWFTLGLFANYFSLKSGSLKLTELWNSNTSLLFNLNHKFINGSLAFSPG